MYGVSDFLKVSLFGIGAGIGFGIVKGQVTIDLGEILTNESFIVCAVLVFVWYCVMRVFIEAMRTKRDWNAGYSSGVLDARNATEPQPVEVDR